MPALYILDWAIITISFFNTIALLWLGLTVLLNAERHAWGTWAAGGGFLLGALFFVGHSAIVGREIGTFSPEMEFWWRLSWLVVIGAPYMWYLVMAWYSGVLSAGRHRAWLVIVSLLGISALALLRIADPVPSYDEIVERSPIPIFSLAGIPVVALIYPVYSVLCIVLSLSALRRPEASRRFMGELARERARPWLVAASFVLLGVSLAIGFAMAWFLNQLQLRSSALLFTRILPLIMAFDVLISALVAVTVVLMGRAIVSYEIFTGKALPRGGLFGYWRRSLILAAGYGALVGASLNVPIHPIYRLLLATVLMTLFYALLSWRSYAERERGMDYLRPFVASQRLYERLLTPAAPPDVDVAAPLRALCDDVLGARIVYLVALGPLAPLVGPGLVYSSDGEHGAGGVQTAPQLPGLAELISRLRSPQTICVPLEQSQYDGAVWAVPLWSERGLIGVLLLGEKRDGGLYTQEEIEIARATGERLIDTQASAEMARRLMALQRQRLAESQVLDRRARRVLHDDVLPRLHTAMLLLSADDQRPTNDQPLDAARGRRPTTNDQQPATDDQRPTTNDQQPATDDRSPTTDHRRPITDDRPPTTDHRSTIADGVLIQNPKSKIQNPQHTEAVALLADIHRQIANLLHAIPATAAPEVARLGLIGALRQAIEDELGSAFDSVTWRIEPEAERAARSIPALATEVIFYAAREAIRNAARYGRNGDLTRPLRLIVSVAWCGGLEIAVEDDGVGLGLAGPSREGSGKGLGLHSTMMAVIGGTLTAESVPGRYTRVALTLPDTALQ